MMVWLVEITVIWYIHICTMYEEYNTVVDQEIGIAKLFLAIAY